MNALFKKQLRNYKLVQVKQNKDRIIYKCFSFFYPFLQKVYNSFFYFTILECRKHAIISFAFERCLF